jgi:hypothetical protein
MIQTQYGTESRKQGEEKSNLDFNRRFSRKLIGELIQLQTGDQLRFVRVYIRK